MKMLLIYYMIRKKVNKHWDYVCKNNIPHVIEMFEEGTLFLIKYGCIK